MARRLPLVRFMKMSFPLVAAKTKTDLNRSSFQRVWKSLTFAGKGMLYLWWSNPTVYQDVLQRHNSIRYRRKLSSFFAEIIYLSNGLLRFPCFVLKITESDWFDVSKSLLNKPVNSYKIVSFQRFSSALQSSIGPVIANDFNNQFTFRPIRTRIVTKLMNELNSVAKEVRYYRCVLIGQKPTFCCAGKLVLKSRKDHRPLRKIP